METVCIVLMAVADLRGHLPKLAQDAESMRFAVFVPIVHENR